jgi:hypothetical protein
MAVVTAAQALRAVAPAATPTEAATQLPAASDNADGRWRAAWAVIAILVVILLAEVFEQVIVDPDSTRRAARGPVQGLTIFAVFFVASAAIERLLEPLLHALFDTASVQATARTRLQAAGKIVQTLPAVPTVQESDTAEAAIQTAAEGAAAVEWVNLQRTVFFWVLATVIAMLASASLRLYFLHTVGISAGPRWVEILATGLIVGGGTKPLHDLIELLAAAKANQTATSTSGN